MRHFLLVLSLLLFTFVRAEKVLSTAEIFETPYASQPLAWLERGAEVWIEGNSDNKARIKIYTKVWVKRKDMTRSQAKANAVLHDVDGKVVGGIYLPQQTMHDTTSSFSTHALIFRGYILKDRIDPKSIPETELVKILNLKKSKVDTADMNTYIKQFNFVQITDTAGLIVYKMKGKDGPRMHLVFKDSRLVVVVPTEAVSLKHFEAELRQASLHVIYLEKLKPEEEELIVEFFGSR